MKAGGDGLENMTTCSKCVLFPHTLSEEKGCRCVESWHCLEVICLSNCYRTSFLVSKPKIKQEGTEEGKGTLELRLSQKQVSNNVDSDGK